MKRSIQCVAAAILGASLTTPWANAQPAPPKVIQAAPEPAARQLAQLAQTYYDAQARFEPIQATFSGDNRFDDQLPMTHVPAMRARRFAMLHEVQHALAKIDRSKLADADQTTYDVLAFELSTALLAEAFPEYMLPMDHIDNMPVLIANLGSGDGPQPIATLAQYQAYLKRISALPQWTDSAIAGMRSGIKQKITLPKALVLQLIPQIKALASAPVDQSAFIAPVRKFPSSLSAADQARLNTAYRETVRTRVLPALKRFAVFLEQEYLPAARTTDGWGGLPQGANWYRTWIARQTTTTLSPQEIHRVGMAEMERIQKEMGKLAPKLGYLGAPAGLPRWITQQSKYRPFKTEEEVLQSYRELNARIAAKLPQLFASMPKTPLEIRPEPAISRATASDHYTPGALPGTGAAAAPARPGVFWAVINEPGDYSNTRMTSLFLHEGQPGHHFQLSRQAELSIPKFRQLGGNNAYVEGWALYAESLGKEMGLYEDPNAYAGYLMLDMRRAARLVVDTGLHALGWSREQTIRFLMEQAGDTEDEARNATERYMAWPAQALGYKIGALKIAELRQRAQTTLGERFSLAKFHDAVLAEGALPLALLETRINQWIAQQVKQPLPPTPPAK